MSERTTRRADERAATERGPAPYQPGKYALDLTRKPDGTHYLWARESTMGQPDHDNMADLVEQGYRPVPADRHPEKSLSGMRSEVESHIRRGGLILMERPAPLEAEYRAALEQENRDKEAAANRNVFHDPNFPGIREISTAVERKRAGARPETRRFDD